jgi:2-iminobutanoate/2-iminopropanoate deaminase
MDKKIIQTPNAPAPIGPYSQAVASNGTLYVSGQIPLDPSTGDLITSGISDETHRVMKSLQAILEEAGVSLDHVLKCSIFVADMNDFAAINEVYGSYFGENPPARETVEVSVLPKNVQVEISCIATLK